VGAAEECQQLTQDPAIAQRSFAAQPGPGPAATSPGLTCPRGSGWSRGEQSPSAFPAFPADGRSS
jgi:hypothetical protein